MKTAHYAKISVFSNPEDDEQKISAALKKLAAVDLEKENISIDEASAKGFNERKIKVFTIVIRKTKLINGFLKSLLGNLDDKQRMVLKSQTGSRLDDDLSFFIRLDKEKLLKGLYRITDSGNCFHIKLSIAAFPAKREKALEIIQNIFA